VMCLALPALATNLPLTYGHEKPMPHCGVVAMEADADGWACRSWDEVRLA
jgi:2,3-bisphosphoglycerate-dependent phosphoglycerate mutase